MTGEARQERFRELDVLRGLAACAVVGFHYTTRFDAVFAPAQTVAIGFPLGHFGVDLFFMISGFVIFMTLDRTPDFRTFAVSRFSRLYPAYWAALLLSFTACSVFPLKGLGVTWPQLAVNLTMCQSFIGVPPVDGAYWSLTYELGFYVAMAAIYRLGFLRRIERIIVVWAIAALVWPELKPYIPSPLQFFTVTHAYSHLFAAGIAFYFIKKDGMSPLRAAILLIAIAGSWINAGPVAGIVTAFFLAVFGAAISGRLSFLCRPPLLWLGAISYPLYLIHQHLGWIIIQGALNAGLDRNLAILVAFIPVLTLAGLITHFIEQPALRFIRDAYKSHQARTRSLAFANQTPSP